MRLHLRLADAGAPLAAVSGYVLGMPHLCPNGLSESWPWKELGHRHWNLIAKAYAKAYGRAMAGFGPEGERPIYAAFRTVSLQDGDSYEIRLRETSGRRRGTAPSPV